MGAKQEVETRRLLDELLQFVSTEVDELGSQREMAHIERIMREGTGADRQLAVYERTNDMRAVVDQIVHETYEQLTVPEPVVDWLGVLSFRAKSRNLAYSRATCAGDLIAREFLDCACGFARNDRKLPALQ